MFSKKFKNPEILNCLGGQIEITMKMIYFKLYVNIVLALCVSTLFNFLRIPFINAVSRNFLHEVCNFFSNSLQKLLLCVCIQIVFFQCFTSLLTYS